MAGRFLSTRDNNFFHKVNKELLGDPVNGKDGIIDQEVVVYQLDAGETPTDMYGESASGKSWKPGVTLNCLIEAEDFDFNADQGGLMDNRQTAVFAFLRQSFIDAKMVLEMGDLIDWNYAYFEVGSINENQLIGGMFEQNYSVVANTFLIRKSSVQIERVRSI